MKTTMLPFKFSSKTLVRFFVVEHITVLLLVFSAIFFAQRAYANSKFAITDQKARAFVPLEPSAVTSGVATQIMAQLFTQTLGLSTPQAVTISLTEEHVNSFTSTLTINDVDKIYLAIGAENTVYLWVLPSGVDQALLAEAQFSYLDGNFDIEFQNFQLGVIPLPINWVSFAEPIIEKSVNSMIDNLEARYGSQLVSFYTEENTVHATVDGVNLNLMQNLDI